MAKFNVEKAAAIVARVGQGATLAEAARAEHLTSETARKWVRWGLAGKKPYQDFPAQIAVARDLPRTDAMQAWKTAAETDWKAAKALVEYLDRQAASPTRITDQLDDMLEALEAVLGLEKAEEVFRAIVTRVSGEETSESRTALRLVTAR